jgi:hypothetical protein
MKVEECISWNSSTAASRRISSPKGIFFHLLLTLEHSRVRSVLENAEHSVLENVPSGFLSPLLIRRHPLQVPRHQRSGGKLYQQGPEIHSSFPLRMRRLHPRHHCNKVLGLAKSEVQPLLTQTRPTVSSNICNINSQI